MAGQDNNFSTTNSSGFCLKMSSLFQVVAEACVIHKIEKNVTVCFMRSHIGCFKILWTICIID